MLGQYLIAFRESFEAALVTAIILSYLARNKRLSLARYVLYGASSAIVLSISLGAAVWFIYGILSETFKLLFEALTAFIAVVVLSSMIYWMASKGRRLREEMERKVEVAASRGTVVGLALLGFILVFREGFETLLFLTPFLLSDALGTLVGTSLGALTAVSLAYSVFILGMRINLQRFFYFTSMMLILIAGGLMGYGTHELLEYYEENGLEAGWLSQPAYDLNIPTESLLHHKNLVGSVLGVMLGYTTSAEWARVILHASYLAVTLPLTIRAYGRKGLKD